MKRSRARSPEAIEFARAERATANEFASTVWQWVRNRRIANQKFRREYPIPPYTADFCCVELKLILEIDGADPFTEEGRQQDHVRDDSLESQGYRVMRIAGYDVLREPGLCLKKIEEEVKTRMRELENPSPPAPLPVSGRGGRKEEKYERHLSLLAGRPDLGKVPSPISGQWHNFAVDSHRL
jgi:very-short-patch-repair endonuclease